MINVLFGEKNYCLPETLNELSGKQLIALAGLQEEKEDIELAKLKALQILLTYNTIRFCLLSADLKYRMIAEQPDPRNREAILTNGFVSFIFKENNLTEQLLPVYKGYHGPKKEFDNLTLSEFHECEINYQVLANGEEDEKAAALNNLVAVLYRKSKPGYDLKKDPDGDIRLPFNPNELEYYSKVVSHWPLNVRLAIVIFYDGCRQNLCAVYDKVFGGGSDSSENKAGMFGIMRGLAGTKYGDFDKVEHLNIHTALSDLEEQIEEAEAIERASR